MAATGKRTPLPLASDYTKTFRSDWKRLVESGRYNMHHLKEVMVLIIANNGPLPAQWKDHPLKGNWKGYRECHVGGDFLLIYKISDDAVVFVRAGTHSELFD